MNKLRELWYKQRLIRRLFSIKNPNRDKSDFLYMFLLHYNYLLYKHDKLKPSEKYIDIFNENEDAPVLDYLSSVGKWFESEYVHKNAEVRNLVFAALEACDKSHMDKTNEALDRFSRSMFDQILDYVNKKDILTVLLLTNLLKYRKEN